MWNDDNDFPSVEDRSEDYDLPELDEDWNEWWASWTFEAPIGQAFDGQVAVERDLRLLLS